MARLIRFAVLAVLVGLLRPVGNEAFGMQSAGAPDELSDREAAVHVLNRLGYGPRPGDVERVLDMGIERYIESQLNPRTIAENPELERRLSAYETLAMSPAELFEAYPPPGRLRREMLSDRGEVDTAAIRMAARASYRPVGELGQARLTRAIYSERQLQEVMVDFWFNHFNVFARKGPIRDFLTEYEQDFIRPNALGRFRDLLGAVAHSPAMLVYLDNWLSGAPEGAPRAGELPRRIDGRGGERGGPGSRRAKGLNENYARELLELHTLGVDGGYTQEDVIEVARVFTGWTVDMRTGEFAFRPYLHDAGSKVVLGHEIPAGGRMEDGELVLDLVARHPSTARFISEKLARRFVSDDPPESLVLRAAATFMDTDGDNREVVRTIVTSPEFFSRDAYRAKVKTPLEFLTSGIRGLGIEAARMRPFVRALNQLDQPLYGAEAPTGYADVAEAWVSAGALLARAELAQHLARVGARSAPARELDDGASPVDEVFALLLPDMKDERLHSVVERAVDDADGRHGKLMTAMSLTLAAPEFQRK